jgi:hypothetical protein
MKTLYFEGAGWSDADISKATDMQNCRVRTAFTNNEGKKIYLEISAMEVTKSSSPLVKHLKYAAWVTDCFYITGSNNDGNKNSIFTRNEIRFEYNKENVLRFVNWTLGCNFNDVVTLPDLAGYRVFKDESGYKYNYGDEFVYNDELTKRAEKIHKYFYELEKSEGKRYPNFSLWVDEKNSELLHLLRHYNGYNKHWTIQNIKNWQDTITEEILGKYAC